MSNLAVQTDFNVDIPRRFMPLVTTPSRYKVGKGGRYSLKSWSFARALILRMLSGKVRVLCARELQRSIKDSVHRLLSDQIEALGFEPYFNVTNKEITVKHNDSMAVFLGIRYNPTEIKSLEGIDICWVEEAERVSDESWRVLIPTIRKPGSEIWVSYNLDQEDDPTNMRFGQTPPPNTILMESNWRYAEACGYFNEEMRQEKDYLKEVDFDAYLNVWEGEPRQHTHAQVMHGKWTIDNFEPGSDWNGPYLGADWGFSQDPTVLMKSYVHDDCLWIYDEAYKLGCELDDTDKLFEKIDGSRDYRIRADNARPETISHVKKKGFDIIAAPKWAGSIEDGITFLRSFRQIIIHESCKHMIHEAKYYRHKLDRLTEEVLPDIIDKNNDCWDAVRYSLSTLIKSQKRWRPLT